MHPWEKLGFVSVAILAVFTLWGIAEAIRADGKILYCTTHASQEQKDHQKITTYRLDGVRPWLPDKELGFFDTFDAAVEAAKKIDCPMR